MVKPRSKTKVRRGLSQLVGFGVTAASLAVLLRFTACKSDPTQIVLEIHTNASCDTVVDTTVTVGHVIDIETKVPQASRTGCENGAQGLIGTLVLLPSGADDDETAMRIVTGIGRSADSCKPPDYAGCIVARRSARFAPKQTVRVVVDMDAVCLSQTCAATQTCENGVCVEIPCAGPSCVSSDAGVSDGNVGDAEAAVDAPPDTSFVDAGCPALCTGTGRTCNKGTCEITCTTGAPCTGAICPPGLPCKITCGAASACTNIDCGAASSCTVNCMGPVGACNGIECNANFCHIVCANNDTCRGLVRMRGDAGQLDCSGDACTGSFACCSASCTFACPGSTNCRGGLCCEQGSSCTSNLATTSCDAGLCP